MADAGMARAMLLSVWLVLRASASADCAWLSQRVAELTAENALLKAQAGPETCAQAAEVVEQCAAEGVASSLASGASSDRAPARGQRGALKLPERNGTAARSATAGADDARRVFASDVELRGRDSPPVTVRKHAAWAGALRSLAAEVTGVTARPASPETRQLSAEDAALDAVLDGPRDGAPRGRGLPHSAVV